MQLKLCGNHSLHDVKLAANSKADYVGFVFANSKRCAEPSRVREWLRQVPLRHDQQTVGVFVNPTFAEIAAVVNQVPIDVIQLHGDEPPEQVAVVKTMFSLPVWKVIHHSDHAIDTIDHYKEVADAFLIDNKTASAWGGTGQSFDWSFVPAYLEKIHAFGKRCLIAGGIHPGNVEKLLKYHPDGIDLASGVETDRKKDEEKISQLQERIERYECHHSA